MSGKVKIGGKWYPSVHVWWAEYLKQMDEASFGKLRKEHHKCTEASTN